MKTRIWDVPLRLFHWCLVLLVATCLYTGLNGGFTEMDYHMLSGYGVLTLVAFRIIWGFTGGVHARFRSFIRPAAIIPYARQVLDRPGQAYSGHNPLGALSVLAMIISLAVQATTGLFASDDIFIEGPLMHLVSSETSSLLTSVHHFNSKVIYGLIAMHLAAIAFYEIYKGQRLILPMVTGTRESDQEVDPGTGLVRELVSGAATIAICSGGIYYLVNYV